MSYHQYVPSAEVNSINTAGVPTLLTPVEAADVVAGTGPCIDFCVALSSSLWLPTGSLTINNDETTFNSTANFNYAFFGPDATLELESAVLDVRSGSIIELRSYALYTALPFSTQNFSGATIVSGTLEMAAGSTFTQDSSTSGMTLYGAKVSMTDNLPLQLASPISRTISQPIAVGCFTLSGGTYGTSNFAGIVSTGNIQVQGPSCIIPLSKLPNGSEITGFFIGAKPSSSADGTSTFQLFKRSTSTGVATAIGGTVAGPPGGTTTFNTYAISGLSAVINDALYSYFIVWVPNAETTIMQIEAPNIVINCTTITHLF